MDGVSLYSASKFPENPLISPLCDFHRWVVGKFNEKNSIGSVVQKIGLAVIAPFTYLALSFMALPGLLLHPCLVTVNSDPSVKKVPSPTTINHTVELKNIYADLNSLLQSGNYIEIEESRGSYNKLIYKIGKSNNCIYLELTRNNHKYHFDLKSDGSAHKFRAHFSRQNQYGGAPQEAIVATDLLILKSAVTQTRLKDMYLKKPRDQDVKRGTPVEPTGIIRNGAREEKNWIAPKNQEINQIGPTDQKLKRLPGYDWKTIYSNPNHSAYQDINRGLGPSKAANSKGAVIAYQGILSNFQQIPFENPQTGDLMLSAEHMFHSYKLPPGALRDDLLDLHSSKKKTPMQALSEVKNSIDKQLTTQAQKKLFREKWDACSYNLMVFVQLCKALEEKTMLKAELQASVGKFIIEDTSKRHFGSNPEKFWGDNGDGTGNNYLGFAQMRAQDLIEGEFRGELTIENVMRYFEEDVRADLEDYYKTVWGYTGPI